MKPISFKHLKNKSKKQEEERVHKNTSESPSRTIQQPNMSGTGVISFAHLKQGKTAPVLKQESVMVKKDKPTKPLLLKDTNFCEGCDRFWPSPEWEKDKWDTYGRCMRSHKQDDHEVWRVIPGNATSSRCYYIINPKEKGNR